MDRRGKMPSLSAAQRVKNPDNEKGERLLDSSHSNLVLDLHKLPKEDMFLKRGDSISLFSIESSGYLSANGFADSACHITPIDKDNTVPDHFSDCVFEVYPGFKYDAQNALNAKLESLNRGRASIKRKEDVKASDLDDIEIELMELKKSEEDEAAENMNEYRQTAAQPIFYGQTIQLLHKTSNKFVTVTVKQIADIEKHCLRVGLDQTGNEGSYFTILPRFKIRSEGEMVQIGDQVLLVSKEHDLYLHSSREKLTNDHWESTSSLFRYKEVNAATVLESWRVLPFASCLSSSSSSSSSSLSSSLSSPSSGTVEKDILMAGDVIRLFHKEAEGYLIFETTDDEDDDDRVTRTSGTGGKIYLQQIVAAEALKSGAGGRNLTNMKTQPQQHQELLNSNALWMVELKRTNRGGAVCYDRLYRFKHMATGHYLSAVPVKKNDNQELKKQKSFGKNASPISSPPSIRFRLTDENMKELIVDEDDDKGNKKNYFTYAGDDEDGQGDDEKEEEEVTLECRLVMDENFRNSSTLFSIHHLSSVQLSKNNRVEKDAYIRLKHHDTQCFLHACFEKDEGEQQQNKKPVTRKPSVEHVLTPGRIKLIGHRQLHDQDAFGIISVSKEELSDLLQVVGQISVIRDYTAKLKQVGTLNIRETMLKTSKNVLVMAAKQMIHTLSHLILSCTIHDEKDPLKREGIPIPSRQNLLREQNLLKVLMDLLQQMIRWKKTNNKGGKGRLKLSAGMGNVGLCLADINKPEHYTAFTIIAHSFKLLKQVMKKNRRNRSALSKYVEFFQKTINFPQATDTLMELFKNNRVLLENISEEQIYFFIMRLKNPSTYQKSNYIKFLSILCRCNHEGLEKNQRFICEKLLEHKLNWADTLITTEFVQKDGEQYCMVELLDGTKHRLVDFIRDADDELRAFYIGTIKLFSNLCLGRNITAINYLRNVMTYELVLHCIKNPHLPEGAGEKLRASFCRLMDNLYINVDPFRPITLMHYTRIWTDLRQRPKLVLRASSRSRLMRGGSNSGWPSPLRQSNEHEHEQQGKTSATTSIDEMDLLQENESLQELWKFIWDYVVNEKVQIVTNKYKNKFTLAVLTLLRQMITFGFCLQPTRLPALLPPLLELLDTRTDIDDENHPRYEQTAMTIWIMKAKLNIGLILQQFHELRRDHRLTLLLEVFKTQVEKKNKLVGWNPNVLASTHHRLLQSLKACCDEFSVVSITGTDSMVDILLDLVLCDYPSLKTQAAHLLISHFSQIARLQEALDKVQILVTPKSVNMYQAVQAQIEEIRELLDLTDGTNGENSLQQDGLTRLFQPRKESAAIRNDTAVHRTCEIFKTFMEHCGSQKYNYMHYQNQRIMKNLDAHLVAIEVLSLPFKHGNGLRIQSLSRRLAQSSATISLLNTRLFQKTPSMSSLTAAPQRSELLHSSALQFLTMFCKDNAENQAILFKYLDLFLFLLGQGADDGCLAMEAAELITEIFRNNRPLCSQVSENQVRGIVNAIADGSLYYSFVQILDTLITANGRPYLKRNQALILKLLLEKPDETLLLFTDPEGAQERKELIRKREHLKETDLGKSKSRLMFHMKQVELLANCCVGKIYMTEVKCQDLCSLEQIASQLNDPLNLRGVKTAWLKFLEEVYFLTERSVGAELDDAVWDALDDHFRGEIEQLYLLLSTSSASKSEEEKRKQKKEKAKDKDKDKESDDDDDTSLSSSTEEEDESSEDSFGEDTDEEEEKEAKTKEQTKQQVRLSPLSTPATSVRTQQKVDALHLLKEKQKQQEQELKEKQKKEEMEQEKAERINYIFESVVPFLTAFYSHYFNAVKHLASSMHKKVSASLLDALVNLCNLDHEEIFYQQHVAMAHAIQAISKIGVTGTHSISNAMEKYLDCKEGEEVTKTLHQGDHSISGSIRMSPRSRHSSSSSFSFTSSASPSASFSSLGSFISTASRSADGNNGGGLVISRDLQVVQGLQKFASYFRKHFSAEEELKDFAKILRIQIMKKTPFVPQLIQLLYTLDGNVYQQLISVTLHSFGILLDSKGKTKREFVQMQNRLNALGATGLILHLISKSTTDQIVLEALKVGIALLHGGNKNVQNTIYDTFTKKKADEGFFLQLKTRISRTGVSEIKEKQNFYQSLLEKKRAMRSSISDPEAAILDADNNHINWELLSYLKSSEDGHFSECGFMWEVLRFLQLLCEGHNKKLQDYLRHQTDSEDSHDLVCATASYLEDLEREIDATNIDIAIQVFRTLTEYCQGPCEGNQKALIRTKLCESVNWILTNKYPLCRRQDVAQLHTECLITLLSLLEGVHTAYIPRQMLLTLNFKTMKRNLDNIFLEELKQPETKDIDEDDYEAQDVELEPEPQEPAETTFTRDTCTRPLDRKRSYSSLPPRSILTASSSSMITSTRGRSLSEGPTAATSTLEQKVDGKEEIKQEKEERYTKEVEETEVEQHQKQEWWKEQLSFLGERVMRTLKSYSGWLDSMQECVLAYKALLIKYTRHGGMLSVYEEEEELLHEELFHESAGDERRRERGKEGGAEGENELNRSSEEEQEEAEEDEEEKLQRAFLYFFVLCTLADYDKTNVKRLPELISDLVGLNQLSKGTRSIEIVRENHLERVYFQKPNICNALSSDTQEELMWNVKRDNHSSKIEEFFEQSDFLMQEMEHRDHLSKIPLAGFFARWENLLKDVSFLLAFLINALLLYNYVVATEPEHQHEHHHQNIIHSTATTSIATQTTTYSGLISFLLVWMGLAHIGCSALCLLALFQHHGLLSIYKGWKKYLEEQEAINMVSSASMQQQQMLRRRERDRDKERDGRAGRGTEPKHLEKKRGLTVLWRGAWRRLAPLLYERTLSRWPWFQQMEEDFGQLLRSVFLTLYFILGDKAMFFRSLYLLLAILGVVVSRFFFAFHLLDVIARSKLLKYVLKSVTLNGKSIILTAVLGVVVVYIYSIVGFLFFRDEFTLGDDDSEVPICDTMLMCFVNVVHFGLRGGGVGDVMKPPSWSESGTVWRYIYDSSFFFLVIVILLNIIFGIIIDTFGELRAHVKETEEDIAMRCFICNLDRSTLDRHTKEGFDKHITLDHNMWSYIYFKMHLKLKPETEYTGPEQFVTDMLKEKPANLAWIPHQRALRYQQDKDKEEEEEERTMRLVSRVESLISASSSSSSSLLASRLHGASSHTDNYKREKELNKFKTSLDVVTSQVKSSESRVQSMSARLSKLERTLEEVIPTLEFLKQQAEKDAVRRMRKEDAKKKKKKKKDKKKRTDEEEKKVPVRKSLDIRKAIRGSNKQRLDDDEKHSSDSSPASSLSSSSSSDAEEKKKGDDEDGEDIIPGMVDTGRIALYSDTSASPALYEETKSTPASAATTPLRLNNTNNAPAASPSPLESKPKEEAAEKKKEAEQMKQWSLDSSASESSDEESDSTSSKDDDFGSSDEDDAEGTAQPRPVNQDRKALYDAPSFL